VNHRFFGPVTPESFDALVDDLRAGRLDSDVPRHGVLCRYERRHGLEAAGTNAPGSRKYKREGAQEPS
jgi:hypothetical protein